MKENICWGEILEKEEMLVELVGDQNSSHEAPPKNNRGQEKREQKRRQARSDCQRSNAEE